MVINIESKEIENIITKPKESSKISILMQKLGGKDQALWRDFNTISLINFKTSTMQFLGESIH